MNKKKKGFIYVVFSLLLILTFSTCLIKNKKVNAYVTGNVIGYTEKLNENIYINTGNLRLRNNQLKKYDQILKLENIELNGRADLSNENTAIGFYITSIKLQAKHQIITNDMIFAQENIIFEIIPNRNINNGMYIPYTLVTYENPIYPSLVFYCEWQEDYCYISCDGYNTIDEKYTSITTNSTEIDLQEETFIWDPNYSQLDIIENEGFTYNINWYKLYSKIDRQYLSGDYYLGKSDGREEGIREVKQNPNDYNLYTEGEMDQAYLQGIEDANIDGGKYGFVMNTAFKGFKNVLNVEIFPGITLALIIGFPLLMTLLIILIKMLK